MYSNSHGRNLLKLLFSHKLLDKEHVMTIVADKRFCIYAQIVNVLIETRYYELKIDIYKGARNLYMANMLYYEAILHPNQELIHRWEKSFVDMVRNFEMEEIEDFYIITLELKTNYETSEIFGNMLDEISSTYTIAETALTDDKYYLDSTLSTFITSVNLWNKKTSAKFDVVFDNSKPMFARIDQINKLKDPMLSQTEVGYGITAHTYPLPVLAFRFADSKNEFGLQLADIVASSLNFIYTNKNSKYEKFRNELSSFQLLKSSDWYIMPSTLEYLERRRQECYGTSPVDTLANLFKS